MGLFTTIRLFSKTIKPGNLRRVALGVLVGVVVLSDGVCLLVLTLGNTPQYLFEGKPIRYWRAQMDGQDPRASHEALVVLNDRVIPQLVNTMLHDTNDSRLRILLVDAVNQLPGVLVSFTDAAGRRSYAAQNMGQLGPGATSAIPALVQVVKGNDTAVRGPAIRALGEIHGEPDVIIPLLTAYLDDDDLDDKAARALGHYGSLAKSAVPKLIKLLHAHDSDAISGGSEALMKIDREAYLNAMKEAQGSVTNGLPVTNEAKGTSGSK